MAKQTISIGSAANDGTGDTLRSAGSKINANFTELYDDYISLATLKTEVAASADFAAFKIRIAAL
tara:strand:- start:1062 stop:1256 length:195 start_codon:yes stop_codon:yes gene_type:complete